MDLMEGTVRVKGTKENVLAMYNNIEDYYDKELLSEAGTDDDYEIEFDFSSRLISFLEYEYFLGYSEEYDCHIVAEMQAEDMEDEEEMMVLEYDKGEIITGLSEYGIELGEW